MKIIVLLLVASLLIVFETQSARIFKRDASYPTTKKNEDSCSTCTNMKFEIQCGNELGTKECNGCKLTCKCQTTSTPPMQQLPEPYLLSALIVPYLILQPLPSVPPTSTPTPVSSTSTPSPVSPTSTPTPVSSTSTPSSMSPTPPISPMPSASNLLPPFSTSNLPSLPSIPFTPFPADVIFPPIQYPNFLPLGSPFNWFGGGQGANNVNGYSGGGGSGGGGGGGGSSFKIKITGEDSDEDKDEANKGDGNGDTDEDKEDYTITITGEGYGGGSGGGSGGGGGR